MKKLKKNPKLQLEKFSTIFTQLGLVLVLFVVFVSFEHESKVKEDVACTLPLMKTEIVLDLNNTPMLVKKEVVEVKKEIPKKEVVLEKEIEVIKKEEKKIIEEVIIKPTDPEEKTDFIESLKTEEEGEEIKKEDEPVTMKSVQKAPVFKGCEGLSERENRACFEKKMKRLILRNFDTELANELGLRSGKKRISTQFVIDKNGFVTDIQIRAPHPRLEKEANRIIKKIPKFKPGYQNNEPAKVRYTLPISFLVE